MKHAILTGKELSQIHNRYTFWKALVWWPLLHLMAHDAKQFHSRPKCNKTQAIDTLTKSHWFLSCPFTGELLQLSNLPFKENSAS